MDGYRARWIWKWIGVDMDGPGLDRTSYQLAILTDHPSVSLNDRGKHHLSRVWCMCECGLASMADITVETLCLWVRFDSLVTSPQKPAGLSPRWSAIPTWRNPSRWWLSLTQQDEQGICVFIWWLDDSPHLFLWQKKSKALAITDPPRSSSGNHSICCWKHWKRWEGPYFSTGYSTTCRGTPKLGVDDFIWEKLGEKTGRFGASSFLGLKNGCWMMTLRMWGLHYQHRSNRGGDGELIRLGERMRVEKHVVLLIIWSMGTSFLRENVLAFDFWNGLPGGNISSQNQCGWCGNLGCEGWFTWQLGTVRW